MTLAELTAILSRVCRDHPELAADEKVRRYILQVVEAGKEMPTSDSVSRASVAQPPRCQDGACP